MRPSISIEEPRTFVRVDDLRARPEGTVRFLTLCVTLPLLLAAVRPAAAQCPGQQTPGVVDGLMLNADGTYRPDGVARFVPAAGKAERLAVASKAGFYRLDDLCPGEYSVAALDGASLTSLTLSAGQTMRLHLRLGMSAGPRPDGYAYLFLIPLLLFTLGLLLFRHHNIVRTNRELLLGAGRQPRGAHPARIGRPAISRGHHRRCASAPTT